MSRKIIEILSFIIGFIIITVLPILIEMNIIHTTNKAFTYALIFLVLIVISFIIYAVLRNYTIRERKGLTKRALYDSLDKAGASKIKYDLVKLGIEGEALSVSQKGDKITINITANNSNLELILTQGKLKLELISDNSELKDTITEINEINKNKLIRVKREELYKVLKRCYKRMIRERDC